MLAHQALSIDLALARLTGRFGSGDFACGRQVHKLRHHIEFYVKVESAVNLRAPGFHQMR
jgi:hypothetical protein